VDLRARRGGVAGAHARARWQAGGRGGGNDGRVLEAGQRRDALAEAARLAAFVPDGDGRALGRVGACGGEHGGEVAVHRWRTSLVIGVSSAPRAEQVPRQAPRVCSRGLA
jgi:hypothetical protein